jgi:Uri superfamily endonuclease
MISGGNRNPANAELRIEGTGQVRRRVIRPPSPPPCANATVPSGKYRWYNDYQLPHHHSNGIITVRLHNTEQDTARKLNRTENLRPIAPTDPDFARLYPRRNDAESINRNLDDTLWLRRAHHRQTLNLLGYAIMVNGLALHRHRRGRTALAA